jgi:putative DNA primase/helicase
MTPSLDIIARAVGGQVVKFRGRAQVVAPGPGHSRADRSLAITISPSAPSGILVHSFAGDDWRSCRKYVLDRLGMRDGPRYRQGRFFPTQPPTQPPPDDHERVRHALGIFGEAKDLRGTPAWTYLDRRGIALDQLPDCIGNSLRWHARCPWGCGQHGCMIALFTDALTGEPRAIHRTAITPAGLKVGRMSLGPKAACVIRLWPDDTVEQDLVLGEGIETTLAAATRFCHRGKPLQPAWAAGDAGNLENLAVIERVKVLTLLVDNDATGRGQRAAKKCACRWNAAECAVIRLIPRQSGNDFNDLIMRS